MPPNPAQPPAPSAPLSPLQVSARLLWIIARVLLAAMCAQGGAQFAYQGF